MQLPYEGRHYNVTEQNQINVIKRFQQPNQTQKKLFQIHLHTVTKYSSKHKSVLKTLTKTQQMTNCIGLKFRY